MFLSRHSVLLPAELEGGGSGAGKADVWSYSASRASKKHLPPSFPAMHNAILCVCAQGPGVVVLEFQVLAVCCVWSGARALSCEAAISQPRPDGCIQ